jgi:hypothetical protein
MLTDHGAETWLRGFVFAAIDTSTERP